MQLKRNISNRIQSQNSLIVIIIIVVLLGLIIISLFNSSVVNGVYKSIYLLSMNLLTLVINLIAARITETCVIQLI